MYKRNDHCALSIQQMLAAGSMQDNITKSFVQRLITEQAFRESAQQVFKQTELAASNDILQRCRALNACLKQVSKDLCIPAFRFSAGNNYPIKHRLFLAIALQGFTLPAAQDADSCSTSDSDISSDSDCALSTSSLAVCGPAQQVNASVKQQTHVQQLPAKPLLLSRPTPVRHAAAITIQQWFRRHHTRPQDACSHAVEQKGFLVGDTANRQQQAALCIQSCWRKYQAKAQSPPYLFSSALPSTALTRSEQKSDLCHDQGKGVSSSSTCVLHCCASTALCMSCVTCWPQSRCNANVSVRQKAAL